MNNNERNELVRYLPKIDSPEDLRKLSINDLKALCEELREFIIDTISKTGGHLGAGLGAVELSVALHYVFNTPEDKLVWDVGHQAYPHKVLTGRRDVFHTIRQLGGISGFLKRSESEYDTFGAGHASTAISAALGMAVARDLAKEKFKVIAIVGDGAMTGGMAYEAMNNAGLQKRNMIVVLNDNNMSIGPNVWAVSKYFTELIANPSYNKFKANVWDLTGKLDSLGDRIRKIAARVEEGIKVVITPGMLFEALGFRYFGPLNGHNINQLVKIFNEIKNLQGPILVHTITRKGKGYKPAEEDVQALHGVTPFDKVTGISPKKVTSLRSYTEIFGQAVTEIAKQNTKVIGITAAMPDGTGLDILQNEIPERFIDVGIAEQHAVTFAAGLSTQGYIPIVAIYSTFLQRAFDQIVHDVALQHLHVVFSLDRSGLVGADGPTHHGVLDIAYLRCISGMVIMSAKDENELRDMLYTAVQHDGPIALRYPRGNCIGVPLNPVMNRLEIGKAELLRQGRDVAILALGNMVYPAMKAAELLTKDGIEAEVINMRFVKPLDEDIIDSICKRFLYILTVEDHSVRGGFGSAVLELLAKKELGNVHIKIHGIPDEFIEHGTIPELHAMLKLDAPGIASIVKDFFRKELKEKSLKTIA
ncbi:MAG: 1-deoxy-D-xylulose-5-phosphate synthase [Ignavibacteriales bacterium]|nr:1-deoxy-D-xylulose-5-phosphate synthase [Ignavibacteriales bacterium]